MECYKTNISGLLNVLNKFKYEKFVFISTAAVYGLLGDGSTQYENMLTPYAKTKYIGEDIVKNVAENYSIFRLFNVYGKNQNPEYGAVVQVFMEDWANGKSSTIYGDGEQTRDFVSVNDVSNILSRVAFGSRLFLCKNMVADVGTGVSTSVNDLQKIVNPEFQPNYELARDGDPSQSTAHIRTLEDFGSTCDTTLEQGISELKSSIKYGV